MLAAGGALVCEGWVVVQRFGIKGQNGLGCSLGRWAQHGRKQWMRWAAAVHIAGLVGLWGGLACG